MVGTDPALVEAELRAGRLACPACGGVLRCWGHARRRELRRRGTSDWFRPRRAICPDCTRTHVLLREDSLARRRYDTDVIGAALGARASGSSQRSIARDLGVLVPTVRGWLRRFADNAERIRAHFTRWAHVLDPMLGPIPPAGCAFADAVEAVGVAARAAVRRLGPRPPWSLASVLSGGGLLANTTFLYAGPG